MYSELKPEKVEEYVKLHAEPWPEVLDIIHKSNIRNYSIAIKGNMLITYYEYIGDDFEADNKKMDEDKRSATYDRNTTAYHRIFPSKR